MNVFISEKNKIVAVPYNEQLANLFPQASKMDFNNQNMILLPHQPQETFWLRKLGYAIPAPVLTQYNFPHPPTEPPFDSQKRTVALLTQEPRAYVLSDMGVGKSRAALWAWDFLNKHGLCGKLLIVATLSNLHTVWSKEIFATLPNRKYVVLHHATKAKRLQRLTTPDVDIYIINHDGMKLLDDEILALGGIDAMVIDELAAYRNGTAERTKRMRRFANNFKYVWGLTGSPMPTSPTDVWAQASIVTPNTVPKYFGHFRNQLMLKINMFKWVPKTNAVDQAFGVLQPSIRILLDDVVELPDCIERTVDVALGPQQTKVYKEMLTYAKTAIANNQITAVNAGAVMNKLMQISLGYIYNKDHQIVALDNDIRLQTMIDLVTSSSNKVLVFSPFKHALAGVSEALTKNGIEHATVSGDTSLNERSEIFNLFQNTTKYKVINAHPQCLAHGLTLTAADTIIWFGPITSLETYSQANARIRRVGQQHKQLIISMQATPIEKKIYTLLQTKQNIQDKLLALFEDQTEGATY